MGTPFAFGLDTFGDVTLDPVGGLQPHARVLRDVVEEAVLADQLGLDAFGVGEHHRADFAISAPEVVLAAIASRTSRIRLGSAVTVLSTDDPVRVFQRFSTLDAISNGRAEVILGRGSFTESYPLFGFDLARYEELFEDRLGLFVEILKGGAVTWKGTTRTPIAATEIHPPIESGTLKTWVGVGGSPDSVRRAARHGLPLTLAIIGGDPRRFRPFVDLYLHALEQHGQPLLPIAAHSPGHVAAIGRPGQGRALAALPGDDQSHRPRARMAADDARPLRSRGRTGRVALRRRARNRRGEDRPHRPRARPVALRPEVQRGNPAAQPADEEHRAHRHAGRAARKGHSGRGLRLAPMSQ